MAPLQALELRVWGVVSGVYASGGTYDLYAETSSGKSYFAGKVGIGVTGPAKKLEVAGQVKATGFCIGTSCITTWPSDGGGTPTLAQVLAQGHDAGGYSISNVGNLYLQNGGSIKTYYGAIEIKDSNINMEYGGNILNAGTVQTNTLNANTVQANILEDPEDDTLVIDDDLSLNGHIITNGYIRTWDCQYTAEYCGGQVMKCPSNKYLAGIEIHSNGCMRGYCCRP